MEISFPFLFFRISLLACDSSAAEFINRYKNSSVKGNIPMLASACPGNLPVDQS